MFCSAEDYSENMKTKLTVSNDGMVFWGPPTRFKASCKIKVKYFPFDVQECNMKFSSWMYDGNQLNMSAIGDEIDLKEYLPNGEWELIEISFNRYIEVTSNSMPFIYI